MTYADFTLESAQAAFGLTAVARPLFPFRSLAAPWQLGPLAWAAGKVALRRNEKSRSEFFIAPVLGAVDVLAGGSLTVYSGLMLSVDAARGLTGECDFILGGDPFGVVVTAPLLTVVEAKRGDVDEGTGQAVAQMVATREFNDRAGRPTPVVFGCVSSGLEWQFMRLAGSTLDYEPMPIPLSDLGRLLATFLAAVAQARGAAP